MGLLGREVHDRVDLLLCGHGLQDLGVLDVAVDESVPGLVHLPEHVVRIGRVSQRVEVGDAPDEVGLAEQLADERGADESAASGNQDALEGPHSAVFSR